MLASPWDENNYMHFFQSHSIPLVDELTLCSQDGIHTLANFVIVNSTHVDLFPQSCNTQGLVASNATQAKKKRAITTNTPPINSSF
jgi:hypothetical protein